MRCHVTIGTLISHPCARDAEVVCEACDKPVCAMHLRGSTCAACEGEELAGGIVRVTWAEMFGFTDEEIAAFDQRSGAPDKGLHYYDS